jgi:bifunctional DNase/RNase
MVTRDLDLASKTEWIEMFPFGVVMGASNMRPVMIFKDKSERRVLPIWLSHMEAGISVAQGNAPYISGAPIAGSPHEVSYKILSQLDMRIEKCLFKSVKNQKQLIDIHILPIEIKNKKTDKGFVIDALAEDSISFCLRSGCKFFATIEYIEKSRVLEGEMSMMGKVSAQNMNPHPYIN